MSSYSIEYCNDLTAHFIPMIIFKAPLQIMLTLDPIILFSVDFTLTREIEIGSKIAFEITKLGDRDVLIPCFEVNISLNNNFKATLQ